MQRKDIWKGILGGLAGLAFVFIFAWTLHEYFQDALELLGHSFHVEINTRPQ
jgi:hypothetical protein